MKTIITYLKYPFLSILHFIFFYSSSLKSLIKTGNKLINFKQNYFPYYSKEEAIKSQIKLVKRKGEFLGTIYNYKKISIISLIVSMTFLVLTIINQQENHFKYTCLIITTFTLILSIPLIFIFKFDKEDIKERFFEYEDYLKKELISEQDNTSTNSQGKIEPIILNASKNALLFTLLKNYNIITCDINSSYAEFSRKIFLQKPLKQYDIGYMNNLISKVNKSDNPLDKFKTYFKNTLTNKNIERVTISDETYETADKIYHHLHNSPFSFKIKNEELILLLQLFTHHIINNKRDYLKLKESEFLLLEKLKEKHFRKW